MNQIDDFFKQRLDKQGLPYKQDYWEQMDAMLDKEKAQKKGFLLPVLITIMCLLVVSVIWILRPGGSGTKPTAGSTEQNVQMLPAEKPYVNSQRAHSEDSISLANAHTAESAPHLVAETGSVKNPAGQNRKTARPNQDKIKIQPQNQMQTGPETNDLKYTLPSKHLPDVPEQDPLSELTDMDRHLQPHAMVLLPLHVFTAFEFAPAIPVCKTHVSGLHAETTDKKDSVKAALWHFGLAATGHYNFYSKNNEYAYKHAEKTLNTPGAGIRFSAYARQFGFSAGLNYFTLSERNNYSSLQKSYTFDTAYRLINPNYGMTPGGNRIVLIGRTIDSSVQENTVQHCRDCPVRFTYLGIPINASFRVALNRMVLSFNAGINAAVLLKSKGQYAIRKDGVFTSAESRSSGDVKPLLLQAVAGMELQYRLSGPWHMNGSFAYLSATHSALNSYRQKPNLMQLGLGLEYIW